MLKKTLFSWLKKTRLYNFNLLNRERWVAEQAAQVPAGQRVLDIGAGACPFAPLFAHCDYRSQDFAQLEGNQLYGGAYGQIDYVSDILDIPVPDASFDVIICTEVLEHVQEPIKAIHEMARILKPGGRVILTAPMVSGLHQEPYHYYGGYTRYWYEAILPQAGFTDVQTTPNMGALKFFSQEAVRFVVDSRPFKGPKPAWASLLYLPVWLLLAPWLLFVVPLVCQWLDLYDTNPWMTIGYHVTATRAGEERAP